MKLPLTEDYRLKSSHMCWTIEKRGQIKNKAGEMEDNWAPIKWYSKREKAFEAAVELLIMVNESEGWEEAVAAVKRIGEQLSAILKPHISIDLKLDD